MALNCHTAVYPKAGYHIQVTMPEIGEITIATIAHLQPADRYQPADRIPPGSDGYDNLSFSVVRFGSESYDCLWNRQSFRGRSTAVVSTPCALGMNWPALKFHDASSGGRQATSVALGYAWRHGWCELTRDA
jgi:hypothetical protein